MSDDALMCDLAGSDTRPLVRNLECQRFLEGPHRMCQRRRKMVKVSVMILEAVAEIGRFTGVQLKRNRRYLDWQSSELS